AWTEVLEKVLMGNGTPGQALPPLNGHVSSCSSALDSVFITLSSSPQVLVPHTGNAHRYGHAVLVLSLLAGSGLIIEGDETVAIASGDIVVLEPTRPWRIELNTD